jgi:hypothetical protein
VTTSCIFLTSHPSAPRRLSPSPGADSVRMFSHLSSRLSLGESSVALLNALSPAHSTGPGLSRRVQLSQDRAECLCLSWRTTHGDGSPAVLRQALGVGDGGGYPVPVSRQDLGFLPPIWDTPWAVELRLQCWLWQELLSTGYGKPQSPHFWDKW